MCGTLMQSCNRSDPEIYENTNIPRNNKIEIDRNASLLIKTFKVGKHHTITP